MTLTSNADTHVKHVIDAAAATATGLSLLEIIPAVVSVLTGIWVCIRIYETDTVQKLVKRIRRNED